MNRKALPVDIQPLGVDHLAEVEEIMLRSFDPRYGEAWSKAQCLAVLAIPGYRLCGVFDRVDAIAPILGFAITRTIAGESELLLIAVEPRLRRSGIGGQLVKDWLANCAELGVSRVFLEVRADNPAQSWYEGLGFSFLARRTGYYRGGDGIQRDAITMQKSII